MVERVDEVEWNRSVVARVIRNRHFLDGCILLTREEAAKVRRELIALARESRGYDAALPQNCLALLDPEPTKEDA